MKRGLVNKEDFVGLRFNVYNVSDNVDITEHFGLGRLFPSFTIYTEPDKNRVVRYIMFLYDAKSPFPKYFTDIVRRKTEAASLAGFDTVKDKSRLEILFDLEETQVANMVIDFLRYQNNRLWSMIVSNEQTFYEFTKTLLTQIKSEKGDKDKIQAIQVKTKLMEDLDSINERLNRYYDSLYGDSVVKLRATGMGITPEDIANE